MGLKERVQALVERAQRWKPVRVVQHYTTGRGPILAGGLAFQALFAVFAALWIVFSIAGLVITTDLGLRRALLDLLGEAIPGLIDDGEGNGAVDPDDLLSAGGFGVSGLIALGALLVSALNWLGAARDAVREMFDLPPVRTNFFLRKALDLLLGLALAALLILATVLSFAGTTATHLVFDLVGIDATSIAGVIASRAVTLFVMVLVYIVALGGLYRVLASLRIPWRNLHAIVPLVAIGLAGLTVLGTFLLGGARNNPLIASFAVVAGLLLYYNIACQIILIGASWMAVDVRDDGVVLDEQVAAERLERARALVRAHEPEPEPLPWWRRLFGDRGRRDRGRRDGGRR